MSAQRRVFPESSKREAVDRVASSGLSAGAVAWELGLHETVLHRWMSCQYGSRQRGHRGDLQRRRRPRRRLIWPQRWRGYNGRTARSGWSGIL